MTFLFETKSEGIISVQADIVNGELEVLLNVVLGRQERQDVVNVARTVLAYEGIYEDDVASLRRYK